MGFVRIWTRQVARAAGASIIAPLVLLLAAGVVASGGSLGGIASLGQISSGPALPDIGLASSPPSSLEGAEIVGTEVSEPGASSRSALPARAGPLASAAPASPAPSADRGALPPARSSPRPPAGTIRSPTVQDKDGVTVPAGPGPPAAPNAVDNLLEVTRGVGDSMPGPLGPITRDILDLLLGPPRP